jgi:hypothetical protein
MLLCSTLLVTTGMHISYRVMSCHIILYHIISATFSLSLHCHSDTHSITLHVDTRQYTGMIRHGTASTLCLNNSIPGYLIVKWTNIKWHISLYCHWLSFLHLCFCYTVLLVAQAWQAILVLQEQRVTQGRWIYQYTYIHIYSALLCLHVFLSCAD